MQRQWRLGQWPRVFRSWPTQCVRLAREHFGLRRAPWPCCAILNSDWDREDDWGASSQPSAEEEVGDYLDGDSAGAYGYEVVGGALAFAVVVSSLKVLWYLGVVCYALLATALQYSVIALALVMVVIFFG